MKKKIISITIAILVFICLTSGTILLWHSIKNRDTYKNIQGKAKSINSDKDFINFVRDLASKNSDIKGYILIPGTNINYPIVQGKDNDYYLNHDYLKNEVINGSIFLSYKGDIENSNINNIIYGHNTEDNQMFTELQKYKKEDFYKKHKTFKIYTMGNAYEYEIVSVFLTKVYNSTDSNVFKYYNYINLDEKSYDEYINNIKSLSLYETNITAEYGEALVSLSTCEYSQENGRLIVAAKRISK